METTKDSGLGLTTTVKRGELALSAAASKAKALVEAKYVIALNRPRNVMNARAAILAACKRPRFAETARYRKPVGGGKTIDGLSIRFAETAIQAMTNITVETTTIWEDDEKRTCHISVVDLESNLSYGKDVTISKTVERRKLKDGQSSISERTNSLGEKTYLVEATEDEIANKVASAESKVIRNCGLRLIPQDILEEAEETIIATMENGGGDPAAETKKIADAFSALNVSPSDLEKYLGHPLQQVSKKELLELRAVYATIKDGESSWVDYTREKDAFEKAKPVFASPSDGDLAPPVAKEKPAAKEDAKRNYSKTLGRLCVAEKFAEADLVEFLRFTGKIDETLSSLAEIEKVNESALKWAHDNWSSGDAIAEKIKSAKNQG